MNILIVENNAQSAANMRSLVEEYYRPVSATTDLLTARELILDNHISLVILRWDLPDHGAEEFCRWIRDDNVDRYVYTLTLAERQDNQAQIASLKAGADDVVCLPILPQEMQTRLNCAQRVLDYHGMLLKKNHRLEATFDHLMQDFMEVTSDLVDAGRVQQSLLPEAKLFNKIYAHGMLRPATQLSGDSFDFFLLGEQYLAFYIADAVGHGSASAMVSYALHHQIKPRAQGICYTNLHQSKTTEDAVVNTVLNLNEQFVEGDAEANRWFTLIYGLIEISTGEVTFCQAGQPPALHCVQENSEVSTLGGGGFPVGLFDEATYATDQCVLKPGDKLLLCSDGAIECKSAENEEFGVDNLKLAMRECAKLGLEETAAAITTKLIDWNGNESFDDDLSVLLFQHAA